MLDRPNITVSPLSLPLKSPNKFKNTENQHPNSPARNITEFTSQTSPISTHQSPVGMLSQGSFSSRAPLTTLINGKNVAVYDINLNPTDKMVVMFNPQRKKARTRKKAHQTKTLKQICDEAKKLSIDNKWPNIEEIETDCRYTVNDFKVVNGSLIKLFRFVISPEKGLVCDSNERESVDHGLMTAYESEDDYTSEGNLPVCAAGEFGVNSQGKLVYANNKTGHYRVGLETLTDTVLPYLGQLLGADSDYVDDKNFFISSWESSTNITLELFPVSEIHFTARSTYVDAISNASNKSSASSSQRTHVASSLTSNESQAQDSSLNQIASDNSDDSKNHSRSFEDVFCDSNQSLNLENQSTVKKRRRNHYHLHSESQFELDEEYTTDDSMLPNTLCSSLYLADGNTTPKHKTERGSLSSHWGDISDIVASSSGSPRQFSPASSPSLFSHNSTSLVGTTGSSSMEVTSSQCADEAESHESSDQGDNWVLNKKLNF